MAGLPAAGGAAALFLLLSEGRADAWWVGVPAVATAVAARALVAPAKREGERVRLGALPGLLAALAVGSVAGAVDVARRVFDPRLPIDPALLRHRWRIAPGPARTTLVVLLNLVPGTVAAWSGARVLRVHALDRARGPSEVAAWERRVRRLLEDRA